MCYFVCKQSGDDDVGYGSRYDSRTGSQNEMTVSTTGLSGQPVSSAGSVFAGQVISHEESGISGGMAFVRRIQIVRIMRLRHIME
ncbi:hypothetical protein KUTeg_024594 [Tegillarca granosa]|uniref:Uncharacterized protein n=1 Tax=Tegillarca granosa TaxID=220873 RepID=A0ABQ9E431_TEGGR|nr:hypothetical protein KUTeg_024594 [Tegillarca granosa]